MGFSPFEVSTPHIIYVGLGAFICIFSYLSLFIKERLYLGEAPIAAAFGIIFGPIAIDLFNPAHWAGESGETPGGSVTDEITLEVMRVTIALSVFAVGVELPKKYLLRHWRSIVMLLGPVMLWGWLITGLLVWALIPGLDYLTSLVVAACVSPTDPILAQAVVGGPWAEKHVPAHVRHMLMCESGCNDGAAFPFLYLALYLTQNRDNVGYAIGRWFYETWAYEIILGTLLGALIGYAARKFMRFSEKHKLIDRESFVAQYVSLAILSMGVNVLLGSDDLLAAFACGTAFAWDGWFTKQTEDSNFSNIIDLLFNVATFIYIGALIPWHDFANSEIGLSVWRLIVLTILVLLLKRLPIVLALWKWIPDIKTFREAVFSGHFGPMGVGAIFIATLGRTLMPEEVPERPETVNDVLANVIQPIVYFFVLCSIVVHGLTIPFFAFGKNAHRRAHTLTRTWSRNPSMAAEEPSWMSRVRKVRAGEDIVINADDISAEKMTPTQLAMIGRGAIGGPIEDELRQETSGESTVGGSAGGDDSSGRTGSFAGLLNRRTELDLEKAEGTDAAASTNYDDADREERERLKRKAEMDGVEDWDDDEHFDPSCDYLGDNCAEIKRYRARTAERRAALEAEKRGKEKEDDEESRTRLNVDPQRRSSAADGDEDIGEAPMDRDLIDGRIDASEEDEACRHDREGQAHAYHDGLGRRSGEGRSGQTDPDEDQWPKLREWVEGRKLVLEYQKSYSEDPEVHVIPLSNEEAESLVAADSPAHQWLQQNKEQVGEILGSDDHSAWHPAESAQRLIEHGITGFWNKGKAANSPRGSLDKEFLSGKEHKSTKGEGYTLDDLHRRLQDKDRERGGAAPEGSAERYREGFIAATPPAEESQTERDERAAMLYGAMTWARDNRDHEAESEPRASQRPTRRSSSSDNRRAPSTGPRPRHQQPQRTARPPQIGGLGSKRFSLRKKVLSGEIGLSGRRGSRSKRFDEEDEAERQVPASSATTAASGAVSSGQQGHGSKPSVVISAPSNRPSSNSPVKERRSFLRVGQAPGPSSSTGPSSPSFSTEQKDKFFPRSASAGAGLAEDRDSLRLGQRSETTDSSRASFKSVSGASTADSRQGTASSASTIRGTKRDSTIQWLDVADASQDQRRVDSAGTLGAASRQKRTLSSSSHTSSPLAHSNGNGNLGEATSPGAAADDGEEDAVPGASSDITSGLAERAERGKNRLVNFFAHFTAPKGEGMGNEGPTSHPHLFPSHDPADEGQGTAGESQAGMSQSGDPGRGKEGEAEQEVEGNGIRQPSTEAATGSGSGTGRVRIDPPHSDEPPVATGSPAPSTPRRS